MGRNKFSQQEIEQIGILLRKKCTANRFEQKLIRHHLRVDFGFSISDFNIQGQPFGYDDLQTAIQHGTIQILDDATIANMKAKRAQDRAKDEARQQQEAIDNGEATDWKKAMKEWEKWEKRNKQKV